jgi:hypothetical protein
VKTIATVIRDTTADLFGIRISVNISVCVTAASTDRPIRPDISNNCLKIYFSCYVLAESESLVFDILRSCTIVVPL